ncbi:MAG: hypothetical protein JWQ71_3257 [Pedosphaera sp.]|nr:hypothetical protein [Pedosphaera sp.]
MPVFGIAIYKSTHEDGGRVMRILLSIKMVGWQGLEPWTNALKGHCSTN